MPKCRIGGGAHKKGLYLDFIFLRIENGEITLEARDYIVRLIRAGKLSKIKLKQLICVWRRGLAR